MGTLIAGVAAKQLGISTRTLAKWHDQGIIGATRMTGHWRLYDQAEVNRLKRRMDRKRKG